MSQTTNTTVLRQNNRRRIYRYIYDNDHPTTKQEIAASLSLSLPTVGGNLAELLEEGLISCSGTQQSTGGRKPRTYALEPQARISVGISIQSGEIRLLAVDMRLKELGCWDLELPFSHTDDYYAKLAQCLEEFLDHFGLARERLLGVGITLPGIINQTEGKLVMAPTLELWDISLDELYCHFSRYHVFIENDANASGCAERWISKDRNNMVYLSLEKGIGGAIFCNDKQYTGDHGRSGEFGHLRIVPNGRLCHCGRRGCLEAYCSISRLSDDLGVTLDEFFAALHGGDSQAAAIWEEYRDHLTDALANLRTNFDCDIVLGGSLTPYLTDLLPDICWELGEKALFEGDGFFLHLDHFSPHSACTGTALRFIEDFLLTF